MLDSCDLETLKASSTSGGAASPSALAARQRNGTKHEQPCVPRAESNSAAGCMLLTSNCPLLLRALLLIVYKADPLLLTTSCMNPPSPPSNIGLGTLADKLTK